MLYSRSRSYLVAVSLLLVVRAFAGPDSVTSFDNRPASSSSSSSSTRSPPGASSRRGISSSTVAGPKPSSSGDSGSVSSCNSKNIIQRGNLSVAEPWSEAAPLTLDFVPLPKGRCVGWTLTADALAGTACAEKSPENYVLVEFWQLGDNTTISSGGSIGGPGSGRSSLPKVPYGGPVIDVKVLAARGTKPSLTWGPEDMIKVVPPIRDPTTGLTPVGSFQDDAGVVYNRPALRIMFPTDSPVTDVGDPADPNSWYITIANMPDQQALPAYALRASCVNINPQPKAPIGTLAANRSSSSAGGKKEAGLPCPVPSPGGKQCNGHGTCRTDTSDLSPEYSRYCACDAGWGSWGCQLQLLSLPLNAKEPVTAIIPPGKWGYWEVTLPPWQGPLQGSGDVGAAAAARGGGSSSSSNEQLLLMAERVPVPGMGGNPLLFLKPFQNKDHNEPALDGISFDIVNYADLRSFQLQLNRQFINYRLPLRESRGVGPGNRGLTRPRRWYVAIYNSNASRLSEPARVKLQVEYRDLTRQSVACPFDCHGRGRCVDPLTPLQTMRGSMPQGLPRLTDGKTPGTNLSPGQNPELASLMALGPLQDLSPVDAGFMCSCSQGFGGLLCEGRVQNLTIGSGEEKTGPELLEPGSWYYYVVTVDSKFNPNSDNLGIQWIVGLPSSPPNNYSNAYISFDQGPLHRQQQLMGMQRQQVRRGMTPYSKLIVRSNPPLPLEVPGSQLSPGGTYVVSIFNNDYVVSMPFMYSLAFYAMGESGSYLHPYMSILLGVTAAVILCLAMTLCKRVVVRYGFVPWRWRQRQQQLQAAAAAGGRDSLALVLMAQTQPASRGVPAEIYQAFPCRPYAVKEFQKRQHGLQQGAAATAAAAEDAADAGDDTNRQDQGARHLPSSAAAAATGAANAAGVDADAVQSPGSAVVSPAGQQQQQPRWRLPHLHWSSGAAPVAAATAAVAAAAAAAPKDDDALSAAADTAKADAGVSKAAAAAAAAEDRDDDVPSCAVCLCEYASGELVRELPCHHEFHQSCIDQWMVSHGTCPICRAPLWAGALADEAAADGSGDRTDDPAAIFVHHDMPPGGRGLVGQDAADGPSAADREWVRMLRQWRERNRQEQRLRRQLRRLQQQEQEQQQQQDEEDVPPSAAAAVAPPAVASRPSTAPAALENWQEMAVVGQPQQLQQPPEVSSSPQQQSQQVQQQQATNPSTASAMPAAAGDIEQQTPAAVTPGVAPAAAPAAAVADERIMGTFTLGRRRSSQQHH